MKTKICSSCGIEHPATLEFFYAGKRYKDGLRSQCKVCVKKMKAEWYEQNREHAIETGRKYAASHPGASTRRMREWRAKNREYYRTYTRNYVNTNREKVREYQQRWDNDNPERRREKQRRYTSRNLDKLRIKESRKRARKQKLPDTFTHAQWLNALNYFNQCCAVCGRPFDNIENGYKAANDHWIPLSSPECPGTIAENIVPLCHGFRGCNNSKCDHEPRVWLTKRYGIEQAEAILSKIEQYFQWLKTQKGD